MCRYLFILTFSFFVLLCSSGAYAQADTTRADTTGDHKVKKPDLAGHQLCIGVDYFHPILNYFLANQYGYEIAGDYYLRNEYYLAAEGGYGGSNVDYPDLKYTTTNNFLRIGFDKSALTRDRPSDWDMIFIGLRLAKAFGKRNLAHYTIIDSLWGNVDSSTGAAKFNPFWVELTGGVRVELFKGICAGWNIRGKFLLNAKSFSSLSPLYIAGYGRGDKNTVFDFNMYLSYAIKWKRKSLEALEKKTSADAAKPALAPEEKKEPK